MRSDGLSASAVGRPRARLDRSRPADLPRAPDRQRGLWTFLTWPFFLLQIGAAGAFFGNGPNAIDEQDEQANGHTPGPSTPTTSDLVSDESRLTTAVDPEQQRDDTDTAHSPIHAGPVALLNSGRSAE